MDSGRALVTLGDLGQIRHACQGFLLGFFFFFFWYQEHSVCQVVAPYQLSIG